MQFVTAQQASYSPPTLGRVRENYEKPIAKHQANPTGEYYCGSPAQGHPINNADGIHRTNTLQEYKSRETA